MAQSIDEAWIQTICEQHLAKAVSEERSPTVDGITAGVLYEIADELDEEFTLSEIEIRAICQACMEDDYIKERNKMVEW